PSHTFIMHEDLFRVIGRISRRLGSLSIGWVYGAEAFSKAALSSTANGAEQLDLVVTISDFTAGRLRPALHPGTETTIIRPALGREWWRLLNTTTATRAPKPRLVAVSRLGEDVEAKGVWKVIDVTRALRDE